MLGLILISQVQAAYITQPDQLWTISNNSIVPVNTDWKLGVGTSNPGAPLDVQGLAKIGGLEAQRFDTNEKVIAIMQNPAASAAHLYSTGDGYLGWVGTTITSSRRFAFESTPDSTGRNFNLYIYDSDGLNPVLSQGWTRTRTSMSVPLYINSNLLVTNNVGIGTNSPAAKLHVVASSGVAIDAGDSPIRTSFSASNNHDVVNKAYLVSALGGGGDFGQLAGFWKANGNHIYNTNTTGNVGVGTSNPGSYKLRVGGKVLVDDSLVLNTNTDTTPFFISRLGSLAEALGIGVTDGAVNFKYVNDESSSKIHFTLINTDTETGGGVAASTSTTLTLAGSKSGGAIVGIDNANPGASLDIKNITKITAGGTIYFGNGTNNTRWLDFTGLASDDSLLVAKNLYSTAGVLKTDGTGDNYMIGSLGIGITNPSEKLHVKIGKDDSVDSASAILGEVSAALSNGQTYAGVKGLLTSPNINWSNSTRIGVLGEAIYHGRIGTQGPIGVKGIATYQENYSSENVSGEGFLAGLHSETNVNLINNSTDVLRAYGVYVKGINLINNPRVRNWYGLYLSPPSGAGTIDQRFGIFQEGGSSKNYFAGNVGIGTTNPQVSLDVNGPIRTTHSAQADNDVINKAYLVSALGGGGDFGQLAGLWKANGNDIYNTNTTGNVGIGTTNPLSKLFIRDLAPTITLNDNRNLAPWIGTELLGGLDIYTSDSSTTGSRTGIGVISGLRSYNVSTNNVPAADLRFYTSQYFEMATERMRITNIGNIGIGTTNPQQQLQLTGSLRLPVTTSATIGVIYKDGSPFIHDFKPSGRDGYNVFIGMNSGNFTMRGSSSDHGSYNVAVGANTLNSLTSGRKNVAVGNQALESNTEGQLNTGVGHLALKDNTTGYNNQAFGYGALYKNATGTQNVAVGGLALGSNKGGGSNSALGHGALVENISGSNNVGIGVYSLFYQISGGYNIGIGFHAGSRLADNKATRTTGNYGVYIGANTKSLADGTSNEIVIGYNAIGNGSSTATYGNTSMLKHIFPTPIGNVYIGTTTVASASEAKLVVNGGTNNTINVLQGYIGGLDLTPTELDQAVPLGYLKSNYAPHWKLKDGNLYASSTDWNVGIGTTNPGVNKKLHVVGNTYIDGGLEVKGEVTADSMNINPGKLTVGTIDPLYQIRGVNYSTFASALVGGVTEEIVGRIKLAERVGNEYQAVIDFSKEAEGSDLWVWYQVVDFNRNNVEVIMTPYGKLANTYYYIDGQKLILRADQSVEVSYRFTAKRFDWRNWPTKAQDQQERPSFIIN